jgi:hypothetical protein
MKRKHTKEKAKLAMINAYSRVCSPEQMSSRSDGTSQKN